VGADDLPAVLAAAAAARLRALDGAASHHRVHHGANEQYLDRNYGGVLVIWDRLFGSFEPEGERVRYGLTTNIDTFKPEATSAAETAGGP
jgi:sterol desaturase/sphingolipid hydroxylase (fatty acid hydroxylase superfamily)